MKAFELVQPHDLDQALAALAPERGRAQVLAGGQDLLTEMKDHLAEPDRLVNLKRVPGLDRVELAEDGRLSIGALVTVAALERHEGVRARLPVLAEAAGSVATPQIRNAGTVGGNLCQRPRCWYYRHEGTPCLKKGGSECFAYAGLSKYNAVLGGGPSYIVHPSDLAPALVALDAEVELASRRGTRALSLREFFVLPSEGDVTRENVLAPDEVLTRVTVPPLPGGGAWRGTYLKFRERSSFDFALASVALALCVEGDQVREARLCLGGVAPVPWRVAAAEAALVGPLDDERARAAGEEALRGAEALAHNGYKIPLAKGLILKAARALRG